MRVKSVMDDRKGVTQSALVAHGRETVSQPGARCRGLEDGS